MSEILTLDVPDDIMLLLRQTAESEFRTPEGQALWFLRQMMLQNDGKARRATRLSDARAARSARYAPVLTELRRLHLQMGKPSSRFLADEIRKRDQRGAIAHTTISNVMSGFTPPSWPVLEKIVTALHGDVATFKELWITASSLSGVSATWQIGSRHAQC